MTGKLIFVTGGGSGLGLALVRAALARGHRVCATGRRAAAELPPDFPDIAYLPCDLASAGGANRVADWALGHAGDHIGCAILNAGAGITGFWP